MGRICLCSHLQRAADQREACVLRSITEPSAAMCTQNSLWVGEGDVGAPVFHTTFWKVLKGVYDELRLSWKPSLFSDIPGDTVRKGS